MDDNSNSQEIVGLVITLAHALDLKVVAEGTETEKQVGILRRLNCEMAQGYFFSRPAPAEAVSEMLRANCRSRSATLGSS